MRTFDTLPPATDAPPEAAIGDVVLWNFTPNAARPDDWVPAVVVRVSQQTVGLRLVCNSPYALTTAVGAVRFWRDARNTVRNTKDGVWRHTRRTEEFLARVAQVERLLDGLTAPPLTGAA